MSTPKTILCIDIEATCWEGRPPNKFPDQRNEIIEIGITPISLQTKLIGLSESILVKPPTTTVSEFCTQLTTLTQEQIDEHGVPFEKAMETLRTVYNSHKNIFASWGDYDRRSFEKNCRWNEVPNPISNMNLNVKTLFAVVHGFNGSLDKCAAHIGVGFEGTHHRGVDDSRMVAKILSRLMGWDNYV